MYYIIDNQKIKIKTSSANNFSFGNDIVFSNEETDPVHELPWYMDGYTVKPIFTKNEFKKLQNSILVTIKNLLINEGINTRGFNLENYHKYISSDGQHLKIVNKTSDLFDNDLEFSKPKLISKLEECIGFNLSDIDPLNKNTQHIIIRIVRPFSTDYNPPHKDMYGPIDDNEQKFSSVINFWIPIFGLNDKTSLPIVPGSHLFNENEILRTKSGGLMNDKKFRVRLIKSWRGKNNLIRPKINNGEILIFSSYLIHGLGINENYNKTRVALEFRLYKKDSI